MEDIRNILTDNQIYLGIDVADLSILEKYADSATSPSVGFYTDFSGVRTRLSYFGIDSHPGEHKLGSIPFPDDTLHAEAIEYLAAIYAVEQATDTFTVVELGAGYGPWIVFSTKAALRKGISKVNIIAVEAELKRHELLRQNLADNGLPPPGCGKDLEVNSRVIHGAVSDKNGKISFGSQSLLDWGASPIENGSNRDYRGVEVAAEEINTYTIENLLSSVEVVDFMHMDVQGFEFRSIKASLSALQRKVRVLLIATHSRQLEGEIMGLLYDNGWKLIYEKPCKFKPGADQDLTALTYLDGTQVWVNTDFGAEPQNSDHPKTEHLKSFDEKEVIARYEQEITAIKKSTSWRITAPLRWIKTNLIAP